MVFVRDLLPAFSTADDKWHIIQLLLVFNSTVGAGFLLSTMSVGTRWGAGIGFQAVFTALCHLVYSVWLLMWVQKQEVKHADFLGGVAVMMNVMLLQTASLWSDFANGFALDESAAVSQCTSPGSAERAVAGFATVNLLAHLTLTGLVLSWRQDLMLSNQHIEYSQINGKPQTTQHTSYSGGYGPDDTNIEEGRSIHSNHSTPSPQLNGAKDNTHYKPTSNSKYSDSNADEESNFAIGDDEEEEL